MVFLLEQQTALFPEVFDPLAQTLLGGARVRGEAGEAEELRRAPVDHLLVDADLVIGERLPAHHAAGLYFADAVGDHFSTSVPRKILQS